MTKEQNHGKGLFYGIIGVATLVVAIIGATFAYFTAQMTAGQDKITGNMAQISFGLDVQKVVEPDKTKGLIPMSNSMIEKAVSGASTYTGEDVTNKTCIDDMGNAVCQIYKITVTNTSSTTMFVDGYIALKGGSGTVTDYTYTGEKNKTTMRWAQVFKNQDDSAKADSESRFSTAGTASIGGENSTKFETLDPGGEDNGFNQSHILTSKESIVASTTIGAESYDGVKTNYIRVSEHALDDDGENLSTTFDVENDLTSLLVLSRRLMPQSDPSQEDKAEYYFVVWLSETGNNQTAEATPETEMATQNPGTEGFFDGIVSFVSAQGGKVTATFNGYTAVKEGSKVGE